MNILVINQPLKNRGDESAHKALIRKLLEEYPNVKITVLFPGSVSTNDVEQFHVKDIRVDYVIHPLFISWYVYQSIKLGLYYHMRFLWDVVPSVKSWLSYFKQSDLVICAPGGICMGGFQNWMHLFNLVCAKYCHKPLAYYGRSFGPFPTRSRSNRRFKRVSMEMLSYFSYLSIRDKKTQMLADSLNLHYTSVVDTAFLDSPRVTIPTVVHDEIGDSNYFVFVPNLLVWHYAYTNRLSSDDVIIFFSDLLEEVFQVCPNLKCIMLPQTFGYKADYANDRNFFLSIKKRVQDDRIIVADDNMSSDIQQSVIAKSSFIIGARYHSVVFAINNAVPFIALSYEHKISGLLDLLGKGDCMIDIESLILTLEGRRKIIEMVVELLGKIVADENAMNHAKEMAEYGIHCFKETYKWLA